MDKSKKNKKKYALIKILFFLFIFGISFFYTIKFLDKVNIDVDDLFLKSLINSSYNVEDNAISEKIVNYIVKTDLFSPLNLFKNNYKGLVSYEDEEDKNKEENNETTEPVVNEDPVIMPKPIVYIYNSHQSEEYTATNLSNFNIRPTVLLASYILEDKLEKYNIKAIVENSNISELLQINNWNYAYSYMASRLLMDAAKQNNPSLIYFIDLHRDSISRDKTTININNENYAKVLFLLGLENKNYLENKKVIARLDNIISEKYPGISKGIYEKGGIGVNGVYNQDFSNKCVLIEVGGVENTIDEVNNTLDAVAYMLSTYIGEDHA